MTKMTYGYCRISTKKQSIERQIRNIKEAYDLPDSQILCEAYTGMEIAGRKVFEKLLRLARSGKVDTIVFDSVSRMSRNAEEGFSLYRELYNLGVSLVFLKEPYVNTDTYKEAAERQIAAVSTGDDAADEMVTGMMEVINRYMMRLAERQIRIAFEQSEKEVADLRQRTKEGLQTAVLNGKTLGCPKGTKPTIKKEAPAKAAIRKYSKDFDGTLSDAEVLRLVPVCRNTYYSYKRQIKAEMMGE